ncbi:MotA/TolQ/ExbB proton channel family protein [Desulfobotulus sp.]|uniref:MotA/TolQ/ExbB proton channel family protein n=1 Tax=Desulfobotulus sp. TaxID=1940337 RepID=UPI002A35E7A7|nr:MotA/TolQ/ExbB proton channel family protein [Desulfobotulus sp.]MDY0163198.1 MotA/TolQ/ExbB proton channel family protein [Desulfobotulus sp.]
MSLPFREMLVWESWFSMGIWVWCAGLMAVFIWTLSLKTLWDLARPQNLDQALTLAPYRIRAIRVLAAAAPLVGLLGTVSAMIHMFAGLQAAGLSGNRAMAGGIAEALMSTQAGLLAAIPGLFMAHVLERRHARLFRKKTP